MQKIISILLFVIFICNLFYICLSEDFKLCSDPKCAGPVSEAVTILGYSAPSSYSLSFSPNTKVKVMSKLKGSKNDLWGVEMKGKRGYVPHAFLREKRVLKSSLIQVPYNIPDDLFPEIPETTDNSNNAIKTDIPVGVSGETVSPANVLSPYEVVDGTTIYLDTNDNIISSTEKSVGSTYEYEDEDDSDLEYSNDAIKTENKNPSDILFETSSDDSTLNSKDNLEVKSEEQPITLTDDILNSISNSEVKSNDQVIEVTTDNTTANSYNNEELSENKNEKLDSGENISKHEALDSEVIEVFTDNTTAYSYNTDEISEKTIEKLDSIDNINNREALDSEIIEVSTDNTTSYSYKTEEISENKNEKSDSVDNINKHEALDSENKKLDSIDNLSNREVFNSEAIEVSTDNTTSYSFKIEEISENKDEKMNSEDNLSKNEVLDSEVIEVSTDNTTAYSYNPEEISENKKLDSLDGAFDSETIEVSTDNTTAYSYKSDDISQNKNEQLDSIDNISSHIALDSEVIEVSTDNTTAYSYKTEEISENKDEKLDSLDSINKLETLDSETIEVSTDNTTAYSYKSEDISENKNDKGSVETVISSPELINDEVLPNKFSSQHGVNNLESDLEKQIDNSNEDVSNLPKKVESRQFQNPINILGQLNNVLPSNEILSNTEKQLNHEDKAKSVEHSFSTMDSIVPNGENKLSDEIQDVNLEQADFLTTVYEFFGIYQSKEPEAIIDTESDFNNIESQSIIGNEEIYTKNEQFVCKNQESENIYSLQQFEIPESTYGIIIYLTITAITVLIFTLGYYYIEKLRLDGTLIKRINELEKALLNSNKEKNILRNELEISQGAEAPISLLEKLRDELEESNRLRIELEEQNVNLERELETATEAGLELNKMLGEYLSSQQSGNLVEESLEYLQKQLNDQQLTIAEMTVSANEKAKEFEVNLGELNAAKEKIIELTSELNSMVVNFSKLQEDAYTRETQLNEQINILKTQLEKEINDKNQEINEKNNELNRIKEFSKQLQHNLNVRENELLLLKENLQSEIGVENNNKGVESIIDNTHIRAELKEVNAEKDLLTKQLEAENDLKKSLEQQLTQMINEKENLHTRLQNVEKEKIETQTRLEVLSAYFKEKETSLQKELSKHEELWLQKKDQTNSTVERIKLLQEEIQNYKSQNEMLKNEIVDQEVSLKSQISVMEKKNHENWLLLRQTERRLEESKHECSQLRNRLTVVEKNLNGEDKSQYRVVSPPLNGDISTSPIHMIEPPVSSPLLFPHRDNIPTTPPMNFMGLPPPPPPPGALPFMPPPPPGVPFMPPPPTLFPGDRRPPPLGRMSSPPPPPPNTFSPTRTFSPYDQDRDSPPIRDRMYNLYDNDNNYRHRSPPPFAPLPPPPTDQVKDWENRQSFRPIDQQRPTNRSKTNLNSNEFV